MDVVSDLALNIGISWRHTPELLLESGAGGPETVAA